ncbi:MAG: hypothetical protein HY558_04225 [Euryarchaeota archaeon]|nr:hypothetical protein [Euryarchaeota archaeon]
MDLDFKRLSYLGESYVQLELARRGFRLLRVSDLGFDFLGQNGARVEVKTALPSWNRSTKTRAGTEKLYKYKFWQFRITTPLQRSSDFFVCVVLEQPEDHPRGFFVFPRECVGTLGKSDMIAVFESDLSGEVKKKDKEDRHQYLNNWGLLLEFHGWPGAPLPPGGDPV